MGFNFCEIDTEAPELIKKYDFFINQKHIRIFYTLKR